MTSDISLTGGCSCGAIRYTLSAAPLTVAVCHCSRCRKASGAAFSVNLIVRASTLAIEGELASWLETDTESGSPLSRDHCPRCGSSIRSVPTAAPKLIALKAGSLDDASLCPPAMHIWTDSKLSWVDIPDDLPSFARGPQV